MSGILGVFGAAPQPVADPLLRRMLGAMTARGSDCRAVWSRDGAALACARGAWERAPELSGDALVVADGDLVVAADAAVYYRADLRARLRAAGITPGGDTPSHLILAAYRAWGDECVRHLEGDFAFIVWDRRHARSFCARDFAGSRPLFYTEAAGVVLVASTIGALRSYPVTATAFNHAVLAETAANLWPSPRETPFAAIAAIPAGSALSWSAGSRPALTPHWEPPHPTPGNGAAFDAAAAELRELLIRAVDERLGGGVSAVWMSGGRDSTAVFAAGQEALRRAPGRQLLPVSVSYPPGDRGREDEVIASVAERWHAPVHWLRIGDIPFFAGLERQAAARDEPYTPPYATFCRALARGSRSLGARVALDGWGGDQLFEVTLIHLADLFRRGRWLALAREYRALALRDFRFFFRAAITPALPPLARAAAAVLRRGRPLTDDLERPVPGWVREPWVRRLRERQRLHLPPRGAQSFAAHEQQILLSPAVARVRAALSALALEEEIEVRSPLYDARILEFALRRPVSERRSGRDTKVLLRAAMKGLLPDTVLGPRRNRMGTTDDYFRGAMRETYPRLFRTTFDAPALADLGIIEPAALRRAAETCLSDSWDMGVGMALLGTLHTELWLQGRSDDGHALAVLPPGEPPGILQLEVTSVHKTEARALRDLPGADPDRAVLRE